MSVEDTIKEVVSSLPEKIKLYVDGAAETLNPYVDHASAALREKLSSATWIPDLIRPNPMATPPPPPPFPMAAVPASLHGRICGWVVKHKILIGILVLAAGTAAYKGYRHVQLGKKDRRARRALSGARMEIVIIAGSPSLPLTRSLALDMERRGFLVYVVCRTLDEENTLRDLSRQDIKPLSIDVTNPAIAGTAVERFAKYLQTPHLPAPRMKPVKLSLKSLILIPSLSYQASPVAAIPPANFGELFSTHLLHPILTVSAFLPLLTTRVTKSPDDSHDEWEPAKVLVFTPSIVSSVRPPFHAPEATVCSALSAFTEVMTEELRPLGIPVTHMKLGAFDFSSFTPFGGTYHGFRPKPTLLGIDGSWENSPNVPDSVKRLYGRNFHMQRSWFGAADRSRFLRGSSLRHLHNTVFDVMDGDITGSTVRVGLGASMAGFVGQWAPDGLVSYIMGLRRVDRLPSRGGPEAAAPRPGSEDGENSHGSVHSHGSHDFIAVPHEPSMDSAVWRRD